MASPANDAFGSDFLPGKDRENHDGATRAMERNYGGQVGTPINSQEPRRMKDFSIRHIRKKK